jgi:hypothetical protein
MMSASASYSASNSFTIADARQVGAKLGADLRFIHAVHGRPSLSSIDDYVEEAALFLRDGYLNTVDFGFKDASTGLWRMRLRYTATTGGHLLDSRPGGLPTEGDFRFCHWYTYLTYSAKWNQLTDEAKRKFKVDLPFDRVGADEPGLASGSTSGGRTYSRNGTGVDRDVFSAY